VNQTGPITEPNEVF